MSFFMIAIFAFCLMLNQKATSLPLVTTTKKKDDRVGKNLRIADVIFTPLPDTGDYSYRME